MTGSPEVHKLPYAKIFGERNTGTNYLESLIGLNFKVQQLRGAHGKLVLFMNSLGQHSDDAGFYFDLEMRRLLASDFGWKHAAPPVTQISAAEHAPHTVFILLAKHPVFWLKSLHRRPYRRVDRTMDFERFIRSPFPISEADGLGDVEIESPVHMLRMKIEGYRRLEELGVKCLRMQYEMLLANFETELDRLAPFLMRRGDSYANLHEGVKNARESLSDYRAKYSLSKATEGISAGTIAYVRDTLGPDNLGFFGYEL